MNTTHHRLGWRVAFAAFALTMVTACGSEIATAPGDIGGGVDDDQTPTAPSDKGSPGGGTRPSGSGFGPS